MAEKGVSMTPMAPADVYPRSDQEFAASQYSDELRQKKRRKLFIYIAAFTVFQIIVIMVFALVIMRAKSPKVKISSAAIEGLKVDSSSYNMTLVANLKIKNRNFGNYKYERTTVNVTHGGVLVGEGVIWKGTAKARDTKEVGINVIVSSNGLTGNSGVLLLDVEAKLRGKVHLMKMMGMEIILVKKRKGAELDCTMEVNLNNGQIQNMDCDD
ncbi:Late embryogenesis abundant protein [Actinidia chinensis var. chinensis]|uniref:Late embryogenesis abundant protein n=1 Tax=Actinidia chinensis var. chinensis TaxID=1590841 RepID=A0A2R6R9S4_ACTCC|nr:Late embryogenesis abundant protein [Actinidia chinensis var. chinensis]PSS24290.1 Late embryogenesis abundant protein [Actinidia chinensis var. chinensis]